MNSIVKIAKQTLSTVVVGATILWSMGASLLVGTLTAHAAPADGSLIKAKEFDSVYFYKGGQRWVFPNLKTYKSWYKDFSTVQVIPRAELETYSIHLPGANIVYRAGTRLVKITTDPKVYAIEPGGKLRWISSEATAKALFGNDWAKRVDDVPDAFFTSYNVGADLTGTTLPDGSLVKSGADYFYIQGGMKRAVSAAALAGNNLNVAYALSLSDVSAYATGTALGDSEVADTAQGSATVTPTPGTTVSGALTVSLASDSPAGTQSVVVDATEGGQKYAKMLKVNFTAASAAAKVTQVQVKRLGVSKDGDVDTLYLSDANGNVLAKNTSFSAGVGTFNGTLFTVPANQTVSVWVLEDVNKAASAGSTQGWSVDATGVKTEGSGSVTGMASGNLFTVAVVTDLGQLEYATSSPLTSVTVDAGKTSYVLGTFKFKSIDQEISLRRVKFTQIGSVGADDLQNFKVQVAGVQYDGVKSKLENNAFTVDFAKDQNGAANANGGLKILAGQTKYIDILGDVVGGTNRNFKFSVQNQEDVSAWDAAYKVFVPVAEFNTDTFSVQTLGQTSINTGSMTMSLAADAPTTNVASGSTAVTLASYSLVASGENMKFSNLSVTVVSSDATNVFKNVKLMLDGTQVGTTVASSTATGSYATNAFTFSNNFVVKVGTPSKLQVVADLTDTTFAANETLSVSLVVGASNVQGQTSLTTSNSTAVSGNTLTVKSGTPTITKNTSVSDATTIDPTGVSKASDLKIGSFIITAGAGEGAKITQFALQDYAAPLNTLFSRLRVQNAGINLAPEVGTLSGASSTYTFTMTTPITVQSGQQFIVDVIADVLSTTSTAQLNAAAYPVVQVKDATVSYQTLQTAQSGNVTITGTNGLMQNVFIASKGSVTAAISSDTPIAQQVVMGSVNQPVFKFKLTAGKSEDLNVTELVTAATIMASSSPTGIIKNIRLYDGDALVGNPVAGLTAGDASATVATSTAYAKFSALNLTIPKNTSKTYTVVADVASSPDTFSGLNFSMHLANGYDQTSLSQAVVAKGAKSGQTISAGSVASSFVTDSNTGIAPVKSNVMTVFKTKITVAHAANAPTGAASKGTGQVVAKFVVSNSANVNNQAASVSAMDLAISTSISMPAGTTTRVIKIYKTEQTSGANQLVSTTLDPTSPGNATGQKCWLGPARDESVCPLFFGLGTSTSTFSPSVSIESGASQTFTVTADTNDATANNTLTVGIGAAPASGVIQGKIVWTDGYTANITSVDSLPLTGKTLTF